MTLPVIVIRPSPTWLIICIAVVVTVNGWMEVIWVLEDLNRSVVGMNDVTCEGGGVILSTYDKYGTVLLLNNPQSENGCFRFQEPQLPHTCVGDVLKLCVICVNAVNVVLSVFPSPG
jgi:hypothetical protein